jgi:hypothetical protein
MSSAHGELRQAAAAAVTGLVKAVRFHRLYPGSHPFCVDAIDETLTGVEAFHQTHGVLDLDLRRDGVYLEDQQLGGRDGAQRELARLLYPEGGRALALDPGVDRQQLLRFVRVLAGSWDEGEGVVARLGREDLPSIRYQVHDALAPARLGRECYDPTLAPILERIGELMESFVPAEDGEAAVELDAVLDRASADLSNPEHLGGFPEWGALFLDSPWGQSRKALATEQREDSVVERAVAITNAALEGAPAERPPLQAAIGSLAACVLARVDEGAVESARDLVRSLPAEAADGVRDRLARPEALAALLRACRSVALEGDVEDAVLDLLGWLGGPALPEVGRVIANPRYDAEPARRLFLARLKDGAEERPDAVRPLLDSGSEETAQLGLELLLRGGSQSSGWALVVQLSTDPRHPRAGHARRALDERTGVRQRKDLLRTIREGTDAAARQEAWRALPSQPEAHESWNAVVEVVKGREFLDRDEEEQRVALEVLSALNPKEAPALLDELANRTSLLRRRKTQKLGVLALKKLRHLSRGDGP